MDGLGYYRSFALRSGTSARFCEGVGERKGNLESDHVNREEADFIN